MTTVEDRSTEVGPPGSSGGWSWSEFPWWLVGIALTVAFILVEVLTDETWREGFDFIILGLPLTLILTAGGFVIAIGLGLIVALARLSNNTVVRNLSMYYIELIRGVPVIVTILFISFAVFGEGSRLLGFPQVDKLWRGIIALGLIYAAFIAEVFRAGIQSIPRGQIEAGSSVGMSQRQVFVNIVMPQAIRNIMPALGNDLIALLKDSALVSLIAVRELTQQTRLWTGTNFTFIQGYLILTAFYLTLTVSLSLLLRWYERRIRVPG